MSYRYEFRFAKTDEMIYISHLDLLRLLTRALRRADLPVSLTQGFNPHFKIKLKRALKLGLSSQDEEGEFVLTEKLKESEINTRLTNEVPKGLEIKNIHLCMV